MKMLMAVVVLSVWLIAVNSIGPTSETTVNVPATHVSETTSVTFTDVDTVVSNRVSENVAILRQDYNSLQSVIVEQKTAVQGLSQRIDTLTQRVDNVSAAASKAQSDASAVSRSVSDVDSRVTIVENRPVTVLENKIGGWHVFSHILGWIGGIGVIVMFVRWWIKRRREG